MASCMVYSTADGAISIPILLSMLANKIARISHNQLMEFHVRLFVLIYMKKNIRVKYKCIVYL